MFLWQGNFMVYLVVLINYAKKNWELICRDIEKSRIDPNIQVGPKTLKALEEKLTPDPKRTDELCEIGERGFINPLIPQNMAMYELDRCYW